MENKINIDYNKKLLKRKKKKDDEEDDNTEKNITKGVGKMDFNDEEGNYEEEEYASESDQNEEVYVDDDHDYNSEEYMEEDMDDEPKKKEKKVNIYDENSKKKDEMELDFDNEAYDMLHRSKVEWPCMTIDFLVPENFYPPIANFYNKESGNKISKDKYPYECYLIGGAQTKTQNGNLYYMKWYNMHKTKYDDDPDKGADSDEEEGEEPYLKFERVQIKGNVNRLKTMKNSYLCGLWSDAPSVEIVDLRQLITDLEESNDKIKESLEYGLTNKENNIGNKKRKLNSKSVTVKSFNRSLEGFAIEWSPILPGVLAAGGQDKKIELYYPKDETCSDWASSNTIGYSEILKGHTKSVEDIIWSPIQQYVLSSCSVDRSIRFWDLRTTNNNPPIVIEKAHESDVNCLSWNNFCEFMIASGGDDGAFKVWDIRYISNGPISNVQWHKGPITALVWDPYEDSQIAVSSEDNRLTVWDFSVEPDDNQLFDAANNEIPQQLIFLHQGQENIKDIKFHPIYKNFIVSTAENGINMFKPGFEDENDSINSDDDDMDIDD
jgi:ribosome assembly protein RRB1